MTLGITASPVIKTFVAPVLGREPLYHRRARFFIRDLVFCRWGVDHRVIRDTTICRCLRVVLHAAGLQLGASIMLQTQVLFC